jgi:hypothetical protein
MLGPVWIPLVYKNLAFTNLVEFKQASFYQFVVTIFAGFLKPGSY